jgi:hypothetical protein
MKKRTLQKAGLKKSKRRIYQEGSAAVFNLRALLLRIQQLYFLITLIT